MDYTLKTSLEHRALVETAVTLWNQGDIRTLIAGFGFPLLNIERQERWQEIEDKVIEKVPNLPLPEPIKKKVLGFVRPIGLEILKWAEYHSRGCYLGIKRPNILCWTPHGTVDKRKTAEALIRDENLDIRKRYKLACIYCLENDIPVLWNKMSEGRRELFYSEEGPGNVKQQELVVLWTYDIKGEVARMDDMVERKWRKCTPYQYAFEYAAASGNKVATEYFLQKLTHEEREESLVKYAGYVANRRCDSARISTDFPKKDYADVLCFLLSQMNEEQQIEVFKSYPYQVLKCFLDWPWQSFFMETANHMWTFLPEWNCNSLLRFIVNHKVMAECKDYNYQKLFGEFWQQSPDSHKRYVIDECASGSLLLDLFKVRDKENISLILKDVTHAEKEKIIFYQIGRDICKKLVYSDEWDLLKLFIGECISSQEKMIKFKEEFKEDITDSFSKKELAKRKDKWDKFFQILDDFILEHNKRKSAEGNGFPAKKLCNVESEKVVDDIGR